MIQSRGQSYYVVAELELGHGTIHIGEIRWYESCAVTDRVNEGFHTILAMHGFILCRCSYLAMNGHTSFVGKNMIHCIQSLSLLRLESDRKKVPSAVG